MTSVRNASAGGQRSAVDAAGSALRLVSMVWWKRDSAAPPVQIVCTMVKLGATLLSFLRRMAVITVPVTMVLSHVVGNLAIPRPVPTQFFFLANAVHHVKDVKTVWGTSTVMVRGGSLGQGEDARNVYVRIARLFVVEWSVGMSVPIQGLTLMLAAQIVMGVCSKEENMKTMLQSIPGTGVRLVFAVMVVSCVQRWIAPPLAVEIQL